MKNICEKEVFENIYDTYYEGVYRYIYSTVRNKKYTEEIISEVFSEVYADIDKINSDLNAKTYIFKVSRSIINDFYKRNEKVISSNNFLEKETKYKNNNGRDEIISIKDDFDSFPDEVKDMINMRYYGNMNLQEISMVTAKSERKTKNLMVKALRRIIKVHDGLRLCKTSGNS